MTSAEIKERLTAIEHELADLKAASGAAASQAHPVHALEAIHGAFDYDEAFQEAMRLGRRSRESQRPNARKSRAKHP